MKPIIKHIEYDCNSFDAVLKTLMAEYSFLKMTSIGKTVMGRDIKALRIGDKEECVLYTAAIHGSERITATVMLRFIADLCQALKTNGKLSDVDARRALTEKSVIFIPMCNPDGCEISLKGALGCGAFAGRLSRLCNGNFTNWNANARGVDLNHNFNAGWERLHETERKEGFFGPGPTRYGGTRPESEPETVALVELCRSLAVRYVMCFHSQGEVIYWDYNNIDTCRGRKMAEIFAASSGYALDVPCALATGGGFKDWFIEEFHRPGFTIEVGTGKNPLPPDTGEEIYQKIKEMMMLGLLM